MSDSDSRVIQGLRIGSIMLNYHEGVDGCRMSSFQCGGKKSIGALHVCSVCVCVCVSMCKCTRLEQVSLKPNVILLFAVEHLSCFSC